MAFRLHEGIYMAETEYGAALLDENSGKYWKLNPTGTLIVQTLLEGGTLARAVEELTEQYRVDAEEARRDVSDLLDQLRGAGLLDESGGAR